MSDKSDRLTTEKLKKETEKQKLNQNLQEKQKDIQACNSLLYIQKNLEKMLKNYDNYLKREQI